MQQITEVGRGTSEEEEQHTLLSSSSASFEMVKPSRSNKLLGHKQWLRGKFYYLLPTLAVFGIVAIVSPFLSLSKTYPENISSSPPIDITNETNVVYVEVEAKKDVKQQQISNYVKGSAILSIHITHHAGTSLCRQMSKLGPTPGFACMGISFGTSWANRGSTKIQSF